MDYYETTKWNAIFRYFHHHCSILSGSVCERSVQVMLADGSLHFLPYTSSKLMPPMRAARPMGAQRGGEKRQDCTIV